MKLARSTFTYSYGAFAQRASASCGEQRQWIKASWRAVARSSEQQPVVVAQRALASKGSVFWSVSELQRAVLSLAV
ncbi:hypothetical protein L195_g033510 [Trifolium pratense]|uniref:Uncharacterized protein n=1 Tax=Trifolium pratense TaxID=57577 RepID=A0A2K3LG80_TRIPR|nr:hypothetical protein L195_g033510 [Trifolium pratense]